MRLWGKPPRLIGDKWAARPEIPISITRHHSRWPGFPQVILGCLEGVLKALCRQFRETNWSFAFHIHTLPRNSSTETHFWIATNWKALHTSTQKIKDSWLESYAVNTMICLTQSATVASPFRLKMTPSQTATFTNDHFRVKIPSSRVYRREIYLSGTNRENWRLHFFLWWNFICAQIFCEQFGQFTRKHSVSNRFVHKWKHQRGGVF